MMYDNISFRFTPPDFDSGYLSRLMQYLTPDSVTLHSSKRRGSYITGDIGAMHVNADNGKITVTNSICKHFHGNNVLHELTRPTTKEVITQLSDELHLPFDKAEVYRLEFGANLQMNDKVTSYSQYLGGLPRYKREMWNGNLYYITGRTVLNFYDKLHECKTTAPDIYTDIQGLNLMRYEMRLPQRLRETLKQRVTGAMLYDERFYIGLVDKWQTLYNCITKNKITKIMELYKYFRTTRTRNELNLILAIQAAGGVEKYFKMIDECFAESGGGAKSKSYLKTSIKNILKKTKLSTDSEAEEELTKKVAEKAEFQRG